MKKNSTRIIAFLLAVALIIGYVPVTSTAAGAEPKIGSSENVADYITVTTNSTEDTGYETTKKINVTPELRGFFGNLQFADTNHYMYSATVNYTEDSSTYGSIRFVLGQGKTGTGETKDIEVCLRPNVGGQCVLFLSGPETGEQAVSVYMLGDFNKLRAYRYTTKYKDNKLSFWVDGQLVFNSVAIDLQDVTLRPGFYSQNCSGTISDIKLWGDVEGIKSPEFDATKDKNLISNVNVVDVFSNKIYKLTSGKITSNKNTSGRMDFDGIILNGDYTFYANAMFHDNKNMNVDDTEYNWEGLIFRVGKAQKDGREYAIEARIRTNAVVLFVVAEDGYETYLHQVEASTAFDKNAAYVLDYHKDGTFDLWKDGASLLHAIDMDTWGYKNTKPMLGVGCEVCNFTFSDMKLVSKTAKLAPKVPAKPEGNGDYADTMQMVTNTILCYEKGEIYTKTDKDPLKTEFEYLPFTARDSYVIGFDVCVKKADESWKSPRLIFGTDNKEQELALFVTGDAIMIAQGAEIIHSKAFPRELNKTYRVDMLVTAKTVSVWVDNILMINAFKTPAKLTAKTGILFEYTVAKISNIDMYYSTPVKYVRPDVPETPVLKKIGANQYNAAEWMKVSLNGKPYTGYFGNKLMSNDPKNGVNYQFENMPITDDMSYYYSGTYKLQVSDISWKGPRFIFRSKEKTPVYTALTHDAVVLMVGDEVLTSAPFKTEIGKEYDVVIYSTPTRVSMWIDGQNILNNFDLSSVSANGLNAKMGLWFEMCVAEVTNISIYGKKVVFNPDFVDMELYNDKYYRMSGVPGMPEGGLNLFQNIRMYDASQGALGAAFDKDNNILTTEYADAFGELIFTDANGSGNLNGLKNGSSYVFSFTHKVDKWTAEHIGQTGAWITLNKSAVPSTTRANSIRVGVSGDALMLRAYQEGQLIVDQTTPFTRKNGQEYDFDIVHGKNWIKVYVDDVLKIVATDLPTYNVEFDIEVSKAKTVFKDFVLYELEDSGLEILQNPEAKVTTLAGKTIYDAKEFTSWAGQQMPVLAVAGFGVVAVASLAGIILVLRPHLKKRTKKDMEIGGR